jgi:DNA polymerase-3 subunit delta
MSSMFSEKKLIILKNIFENAKFQEEFLENISDIKNLKDIVVIYEDNAVDKRAKFLKELLKNAKCQEFNLLQPSMLRKWAAGEFEKNKAKIDSGALDLLIYFVKNNLWRLSNEINKLLNYKRFTQSNNSAEGGIDAKRHLTGGVIKKEDIEALIKPDIENDIFKTIDALASKNKKEALSLLHKHLESGDNPIYLLSMLAYQFRNLLIVKELIERKMPYGAILKKSGLHPFVVKKTYYMCNGFSFSELKKIYQKIFQIDLDIKTGKIEAETALDLLLSYI